MKILIDARFYGLEHTGIGRYVINLTEELKELGSEEEFVILLRKKYFNRLKFPGNWKKILLDVPHYTLREQILLPIILYKERPDVFHTPQINVPVFYFGNTVVTIHDLTQLDRNNNATTLPKLLYYIKHFALRIAFRRAIQAKKIIVPTDQIKKQLKYLGVSEKKVNTIYEGFDEKIVSDDDDEILERYGIKRDYFVYVGNAYPHKNIKRAIDAILLYNSKTRRKVIFVIVSARSTFTNDLEDYTKKRRAKKHIRILGFIPDEELGVLLINSKGFLYPSLAEGFGLPGLEAMALGTPVLASDIPVFREVYGDSVIYFNPYKVEDIKNSLKFANDLSTKDRKKLIEKGKKVIEKYSWKKMSKETFDLYKNVGRS